jgi:hypothetical protein
MIIVISVKGTFLEEVQLMIYANLQPAPAGSRQINIVSSELACQLD